MYTPSHLTQHWQSQWPTREPRRQCHPAAKGTISSGVIEGFNNKAKLTMRNAYGFRTEHAIKVALYHQLGKLPQPNFTHEFS